MKDNRDMVFQVGRARLMNGPNGTPFPANIRQAGGRLELSGVFHPEAVANDGVDARHARSLAFIQQWLGLTEEVGPVPVVSERRPELSGLFRVAAASVDWLRSLTVNGGTVAYSAVLERVGSGSAKFTAEYLAVQRGGQGAGSGGRVWLPSSVLHHTAPVALDGCERPGFGDVMGGPWLLPVGTFAYAIPLADYFSAACQVEVRHSGPNGVVGDWEPMVGRHVGVVRARDVRISNGLVRCVWSDETGGVLVEAVVADVDGGRRWVEVAEFAMSRTGVPVVPKGVPVVLQNRRESVSVRFAVGVDDPTVAVDQVALSLDMGQWFVRGVGTMAETGFVDSGGVDRVDDAAGVMSSVVNADGLGWLFAHNLGVDADAGDGRWSIGGAEKGRLAFALGVWSGTVDGEGCDSPVAVRGQWFAGVSATHRVISQ